MIGLGQSSQSAILGQPYPAHCRPDEAESVRHILQMDLGHITQAEWLEAIELLGTKVAPLVRAATLTPEVISP